jgi:hypothetical protein
MTGWSGRGEGFREWTMDSIAEDGVRGFPVMGTGSIHGRVRPLFPV